MNWSLWRGKITSSYCTEGFSLKSITITLYKCTVIQQCYYQWMIRFFNQHCPKSHCPHLPRLGASLGRPPKVSLKSCTLRFMLKVDVITQPLGKFLSFLEDPRTFEGRGRTRGLRRFRKAHLENILPRGSRDRDPKYPKGDPWDQNFLLKIFFSESYLGVCMQVWGLLK